MTLATRRWGPRIGGLLTGLPVVAGPTLCFYALEQGEAFAARAAHATLLALVAVAGFCVVYARVCARWPWPGALAAAWLVFAGGVYLLSHTSISLPVTLTVVVASCLVARAALPAATALGAMPASRWWDLPLRMTVAAALVLTLTSIAGWLGPDLSGLLTPFPVATAIIAAFTHAQRGTAAALAFFRGFVTGLVTFAAFCFVMAVALGRLPLAGAVGAALAAQLALQAAVVWRTSGDQAGVA